jgi:hypothetical protein
VYQKSDKHLGDLSDVLTTLLDANILHIDNEPGSSEAVVSSDEERSMRRVKELQQALYSEAEVYKKQRELQRKVKRKLQSRNGGGCALLLSFALHLFFILPAVNLRLVLTIHSNRV